MTQTDHARWFWRARRLLPLRSGYLVMLLKPRAIPFRPAWREREHQAWLKARNDAYMAKLNRRDEPERRQRSLDFTRE